MGEIVDASSIGTKEDEPIPVTQEQIDSLKRCITEKIKSFKEKRKRNKIGAIVVQSLLIVFSILTTVLIGWKNQNPESAGLKVDLTNLALLASALTAGLAALDKFFDYKALWVEFNVSIAALQSANSRLNYLSALGIGRLKQNQIEEVYNLYESTCSNMGKSYQKIRYEKNG